LNSNATMAHFGALLHALLSSLTSHFVDKLRDRIGNPVGISVRGDIAEMVTKISCSESKLVHKPLDKDDPKCGCPDITRVREVLGSEPRVPAREGLNRALE
jgi:nucleoside-diphosphate-sugar epimerase